jgi:hypothetical protein
MAPKDWKLHEKTVPIKLHQGPSEKGKHNIALGNYTHDPTKSFGNAIDSMFLNTMIARPPALGASGAAEDEPFWGTFIDESRTKVVEEEEAQIDKKSECIVASLALDNHGAKLPASKNSAMKSSSWSSRPRKLHLPADPRHQKG